MKPCAYAVVFSDGGGYSPFATIKLAEKWAVKSARVGWKIIPLYEAKK